ncbi:unnamed protein product [Rotaria sordida]|uniref:Uncharacterized protein n=1 Tax=Rotaria sordida TaxID=392033 RepID=A0A816DTS7_9BILA|nr:unnamed protein product [Rotaria sordida]CAF1638971.1 unnamed protein product [Rotaria sordida]
MISESMTSSTIDRRNTLLSKIDLSRQQPNSQQQDIKELTKFQKNIRNFHIFSLILFFFLFMSVAYSFIRMFKNLD